MRVGIDLACWANRRGYGRYTRCLVSALLASETTARFVLFVDAPTAARETLPEGAEIVVVPTREAPAAAASADGRRSLRDLWAFRRAVDRTRLDVFWVPSVYTYVPVRTGTRVLLGVHDTIAEDYPELVFPLRRQRWLWNLKNRFAHHRADFVLAVSEHARRSIARHFPHPPDCVFVVDEAPDAVFRPLEPDARDPSVLQRLGLAAGSRFLLYLGGINPHKNLPRLVEALSALRLTPAGLDLQLVVVGDLQDGFTPGLAPLREHIERLGLVEAVRFSGFLADEEVVQLMNQSLSLVLASLAEGFGLPAVEAAACGTPVVATRNSPLPTLLEGGGRFVDPTSTQEIVEAISAVIGDEETRRRLGSEALRQAARLSWSRSARQLSAVFETISSSQPDSHRSPNRYAQP